MGNGQNVEDETPLGSPSESRPGTIGTPPTGSSETRPETPRGWRRIFQKKDDAGAAWEAKPKPAKSPSLRGRQSAAETIADLWALGGSIAAHSPRHVPVGRYMQFQAPVAGEMLDEAIKGSPVDRLVIQRVVKARARFDLASAVFGPPLIILAIESNPALMRTLGPVLEAQIRSSLPLMVPAIKKIKAKQQAAQDAAEELFRDDETFDPAVDPVQQIMAMVFGDWVPPGMVMEEPGTEPVDRVA